MNILVFDSETNGYPKFKNNWFEQHLTGRVISLAWELVTEGGVVLSTKKFLIKPEGWKIPKEPFWIQHGFNQDISTKYGFPITTVLPEFIKDFNNCQVLVAHNIAFDKKVVFAELCRAKIVVENHPLEVCTMMGTINHCQLKDGRGNNKRPKLIELYNFLFNKTFEGAHDALRDVKACKECFFELVKRNVIFLSNAYASKA